MVRRARSRRNRKGSGAAGFLFGVFLFALVCAAAVGWYFFLPTGPETETFVQISPGSSSRQIGVQLEQAGVIRSQYSFDAVRLWKRGSLKAGEYRFEHVASVTEVYARIARGDVYTLAVTVPEGSTRFDIAARVEQAGLVPKAQFLAASAQDTNLISDLDPHAKSLEGYLFPDTYRFQRKATALQIVSAMVRRFRVAASAIGLSPASHDVHSIVTLASLVERESAVDSERPKVASVLSNRLEKNMPLMTDPAVIYGLEVEGKWRGSIYQSDLALDTPYNTYRHVGLPPGPIANPGIQSLRAALAPAPTDYLYFVAAGADPQGKSRFAATLEEHNKNVASYRKAVKQAGGR